MRLVFLGSPPFATPILERLAGSAFRPLLVVTPPERRQGRGRRLEASPLALLAQREGLELLQVPSVRPPEVLERLREAAADVFLVVSYGELLRQELLELPRLACLNVHPSLLPRHRGATPVQAAILAGDEETGVSIQRVVLELDAGDVLVQRRLAIRPGETAGELAARLAELSGEAVLEALAALERGTAVFTPQDPARATVCRRLAKEDGAIDWTRPAVELERHVRAMNPWPLATTALPDGTPLAVWRAQALPVGLGSSGPGARPGEVLQAEHRLLVATGEGVLELLEVQAAGRRALSAELFLRGTRLAPGERLGA